MNLWQFYGKFKDNLWKIYGKFMDHYEKFIEKIIVFVHRVVALGPGQQGTANLEEWQKGRGNDNSHINDYSNDDT